MVFAMASGEITPVSNTLSPSRVTSRSSCSVLSLCACTDAIANRQELDPISIAANVGMLVETPCWVKTSELTDSYTSKITPSSTEEFRATIFDTRGHTMLLSPTQQLSSVSRVSHFRRAP